MATPNMPSSAQDIINNFLSGGYASQAQANPYRVNVDPFRPPVDTPDDNPDNDPCPEGYVYDPVIKSCVPIDEVGTGDSSDDQSPEVDPNKNSYNNMLKDTGTIFGASNFLDDYVIDSPNGDILLKFDPNINKLPFFYGLGDAIFGGEGRRAKKFLDSVQTYQNTGDGQYLNDGTYQVYNPQQYFNTVKDNSAGFGTNMNINQAVDSVMNPQPQDGSKSSGSPIAEDLSGGLLGRSPLISVDSKGNKTRNDTAYRAAVARNIESNIKNNPYGVSGFKEGVGFTRGR